MPGIREADRDGARVYLRKAREFLRAAQHALAAEDWNAAALNAIHAGISANDAFLVWRFGLRSAGTDHLDAVDLLLRQAGRATAREAETLLRLLRDKSVVEYSPKAVRAPETRVAVLRAERLVARACDEVEGA